LRDDEREAVLTIPPVVEIVVGRVQPLTVVITINVEEIRIAIGMCGIPSMSPPLEYSQG
jgi:hypothetical protein